MLFSVTIYQILNLCIGLIVLFIRMLSVFFDVLNYLLLTMVGKFLNIMLFYG